MKARNIAKKATGMLPNAAKAMNVKDIKEKAGDVTKKAGGALSNSFDAVKDGNIGKMAKKALPGAVDTLKGEKGRGAQIAGWSTVVTVGAGVVVAGVTAAPLAVVGIAADLVTSVGSTRLLAKMDATKKAHQAELKAQEKVHEAKVEVLEEKLKAYEEERKGQKQPKPPAA